MQPPGDTGAFTEKEFTKTKRVSRGLDEEGLFPLCFCKFFFSGPKGPAAALGVLVASLAVSFLPLMFARCFDDCGNLKQILHSISRRKH